MLRFFDMFSSIGGFQAGLERAGGFTCIGHCEIDRYADKAYRTTHNIKEVVHALGFRLKAAHEASVGAAGAEQEAAL